MGWWLLNRYRMLNNMNKKIFSTVIISLLIGVLGVTNPSFSTFESFVLQGMGIIDDEEKYFSRNFSNIGVANVSTRDNYGLFSIFEISPSFIASMEVRPNAYNYDTRALRIRFLGVGGSFYALPGTEKGVRFMYGYFALCYLGAIDCMNFLKKYKF